MAKPVPVPDSMTEPYWTAANDGRLVMQRCTSCSAWLFPPRVACRYCQCDELTFSDVSGRGQIYSYTVVRQAFDPRFAADIPYVVALVELEEDPGLRVLTNIVGVDPAEARVGMPVQVTFEQREGRALPVFSPC